MDNMGEMILDHYEKYLGEYVGAKLYSDNEHQIQILGFDKAIENCLLFATLGLSKCSENINNCCEVIMATDSDYDQCADIFMNAIFYAVSTGMNFDRGVLIGGVGNIFKEFTEQHKKAAVYFTEPYIFPEKFSTIAGKCKVYMGFFVSQNEVDYVKEYGCEQFEELLEQKEADVINIDRKSVI